MFDTLVGGLGLSPLPSDADRLNLERLAAFLADWEKKSEDKSLAAFIEYFDFFLQAGGEMAQTEEPADDAVQLLTVHAAKGLEFDHVFVLTVSDGEFPARPQAPVLEFPAALMKEEQPKGEFRIQEERRLFYVALTRARRLLTLSTIVNSRKKWSPFLEDILEDPKLKAAHTEQLAPKVNVPKEDETVGSLPADPRLPQLFPAIPESSRAYSRIALWAKAFHPPLGEPLQLSASAIETYRKLPDEVSAAASVGNSRRPAGGHDFWQRDAHDDSRIRSRDTQGAARAVRRSCGDFRARVVRCRISGRLSRGRIPQGWARAVAGVLRKLLSRRRRMCCIKRRRSSCRSIQTWRSSGAWTRSTGWKRGKWKSSITKRGIRNVRSRRTRVCS